MRNFRKYSNKKYIVVAVFLLLTISLGYAALSTTLTINGTANISSNSWLVYFTNVEVKAGSVTATAVPTTSGTSTTSLTWEVSMDTPGQFYEYTVDIKNDGTIDAMLGSLSNTSLTTNQAKYLNYTVTYSDGVEIEQYDRLNAGETEKLKVRVELKKDLNPEDLPGEGATINLTYTSNYVQADENAKVRNRLYPINYGVQIYGINEDVDSSGNPIGLTFGPASGDIYNNKYVTHEYEEITGNPGNYYVKIITHTVANSGDETTVEEYLKNSESENVTRTEQEKNKYDINMHEMTWAQISAVPDKTDFLDCLLCGDTKKVELSLNSTIGSGTTYDQYGDGTGVLTNVINPYYRMWNPAFNNSDTERNNSAVGTGVYLSNAEKLYGSSSRYDGGYSVSHIRATLIGKNEKTNIGYAGDINLNTGNCLYSCIQSDLRNIIIAKKVKYVTNGSTLNEDIFDKIWLFSEREMYGTGKYTGGKLEGLGPNGDGYSKFGNTNSRYYLSSYNDKTSMQRRCYDEAGIAANWSNRSPYNVNANSITHVRNDGGLTAFGNACGYNCFGFGFCIN